MSNRLLILTGCFVLSSESCAIVQHGRSQVARGATWNCVAPNSAIAQRMRTWVSDYTAPKSAAADSYRARLQLPLLPMDSVAVVQSPSVCEEAGLAYARAYAQRLSAGTYQMAVVRAGSSYVVRGVTAPEAAGEWNTIAIFDAKFRLTNSVLGF